MYLDCGVIINQRLFQHTFGTHPQTFTKRLKRDFFHNWLGGLPGVCSRGVETTLELRMIGC